MNSQLLFSLKEVIISYHKHEIFHDLDLNIQRKDFIALVGKNGVGKSTLMNVISGNHEIDKGEIWSIDNISVRYFSQNLQFDNEGRILLSSKLLSHAKIKKTMLFVGQGKTFQIWEPKLFEKFKVQARKKANLNRSSLKWENKFKMEGK